MLTSWHFGAGRESLGQNYVLIKKSLKTGKKKKNFKFVTKKRIFSY